MFRQRLFSLVVSCIAGVFFLLPVALLAADAPSSPSPANPSAAIFRDLRRFGQLGSVLFIAAHPDDENTQLIAYLAGSRNYRTAYLSLTRGDGGQNVLGPEFGEQLGVIRTHELLAARQIDGGQQFFTRALDFGFSKDYRETLRIWDRQQVLADMVRVIRTFQPDVVIARFSPEPGNTHGHHTASAVLAVEAFKLAGDPKAFPEQIGALSPWQPKRILQNGNGNTPGAIHMDVSGEDPVTGKTFGEIARRSRSMHRTQGFANFAGYGGSGPKSESFTLLGGEPATRDIFDNIETPWSRLDGGAEIGRLTDQAIVKFNPENPADSVPAILAIRARLATLAPDRLIEAKRRQLDHILQSCLGLTVETTVPEAEAVPGETLKLHHVAMIHSTVPVRWIATRYPKSPPQSGGPIELKPDEPATRDTTPKLPAGTPVSQPYWLREPAAAGMFRVDDPNLIGLPENPPAFPIEEVFEIAGQTLIIADEPMQVSTDAAKGEARRRLEVIPPVSLNVGFDVALFSPPGASKPIAITVTASRAATAGTLELASPPQWKITPASQPFKLDAPGDHAQLTFNVTAPQNATTGELVARATINGSTYDNQRQEIHYPHIPPILLQPPARIKAVSLDLAIRGQKIAYLPGAGDSVADCLAQMGYSVTLISGADLTPDRLKDFDAVVVGVRALNVRTDLANQMRALFDYVRGGGNVIMQYNTPGEFKVAQAAPYDFKLSRDMPRNRVTDETAAVTLLVPNHPAFNTPNKITPADFDNWVQERGLNFPSEWDEKNFAALLSCNDPGEPPLRGGLLVAHHGQGYFVYTGLAWFRQLPAGVPGAYRLFANLVSLGK